MSTPRLLPRHRSSLLRGWPDRSQLRRLRIVGLLAAALVALGYVVAAPIAVSAESPVLVAEEVAADGVYVAPGRTGFDEEALIAAVEDARFDGLRMVVVVPRDPQPTPSAFARRVQEQTELDAAVVFPAEGPLETYVIEDLSASRIRATEAAREFVDPTRAVEAFATEMMSVREAETPEIVNRILNALVLLTLVVGVVVALEMGIAWLRKPSKEARV